MGYIVRRERWLVPHKKTKGSFTFGEYRQPSVKRGKYEYHNVVRTKNGVLLTSERWNQYENNLMHFKHRVLSGGRVKLHAPEGYESYGSVLSKLVEKVTFKKSSDVGVFRVKGKGVYEFGRYYEGKDTFDHIIEGSDTRSRKPKGRYQYVVRLRLKRGLGDSDGYVFGRSRMSPLADGRVLTHDEMRYEAWENALGRLAQRLNKSVGTDLDEGRALLDSHIAAFQEGYVQYSAA